RPVFLTPDGALRFLRLGLRHAGHQSNTRAHEHRPPREFVAVHAALPSCWACGFRCRLVAEIIADRWIRRQWEARVRKIGGVAAVAMARAFAAPATQAQDWPNKPVKIVVPFGAGGAADRLGRLAADHLSRALKQQFYIENRVGAGGAVASKDVVRADPD